MLHFEKVTLNEVLPQLKKLIRIPSVSGNEHDLANYLEKYLSSCGFKSELVQVQGCGPTILARNDFKKKKPTLLFYGHIDTVKPCEGWDHSPFKPVIKNNLVYGLGACDMKGGLSALICSAEKIINMDLDCNVLFAFATDEELYSRGCDTLIRRGKLRGVDAAISAEPTGLSLIEIGRRGRIVYDVKVRGHSSHGAIPEQGVNAVNEASKLILNLEKLPLGKYNSTVFGSVSVLSISGGTEFLSVPDSCHILIDRHLVPGESKEAALSQLENLVKSLNSQAEFKVKIMERKTPFMDPYILKEDAKIIKIVEEACQKVIKTKPRRVVGLSVADENYLVNRAKIPTVTIGPSGGNDHSPNEYVNLSSVVDAANIYVLTAAIFSKNYLNKKLQR
jgi:acetylornithine deacetylase/succinyl-diaminopimelate desuccinylase family protein